MIFPTYKNERQKIAQGFRFVAGCDEVGIGPLAGPVVAATVILDPLTISGKRSSSKWWARVRDSKTVSEKERAMLVNFITDNCIDWAVGIADNLIIDKINIFNAAHLAVKRSFEKLKSRPDYLFVDGKHKIKELSVVQETVIAGDRKILSIAAASIVAKVTRDRILGELHEIYPKYGFEQHKGYPTQQHKQSIIKHGVTPVHRKSFAFVQQYM